MMAERPYRPSNGTEGMSFMEHWCDRCISDTVGDGCQILADTFVYDVDDPRYPQEWRCDDGEAWCRAFLEKKN